MENGNCLIFFFFLFIREFSFCGKRELEKLFFSFFFFYPRNLVLWKTRIGELFFFFSIFIREFSFCGKRELENFFFLFFFFLSENSPFVVNQNRRIFFFFFFFLSENSPFVEN